MGELKNILDFRIRLISWARCENAMNQLLHYWNLASRKHVFIFCGKHPLWLKKLQYYFKERQNSTMTQVFVQESDVFSKQDIAKTASKSLATPCHLTYLCFLPLSIVATGAVLMVIGLSSPSRNALATAGITVYIAGVVCFVVINLMGRQKSEELGNHFDSHTEITIISQAIETKLWRTESPWSV